MALKNSNSVAGVFTTLAANSALFLTSGCAYSPWKGDDPRGALDAVLAPELDHTGMVLEDVTSEASLQTISNHPMLKIDKFLHRKDDFTVEKLNFTSSSGDKATAYLTIPDGEGPHPVIVVFPVLSDSLTISEMLAKQMAREGYAVLRMTTHPLEFVDTDNIETPMTAYRHAVLDARRMIDWMQEERSDIDGDKIGVAGVSLGSLLSSTLMGVDEDIKGGTFFLVGGGLAEIMSDSTNENIEAFRRRLMEKQMIENRDDLVRHLHGTTQAVDPLTYAANVDPCRVLMITGRADTEIPTENSEMLWNAFGEPDWRVMPTQHKKHVAMFFYWMMNRAADHFDKVLREGRCEKPSASVPDSSARAQAVSAKGLH
jgi:dienelactone hydrolase